MIVNHLISLHNLLNLSLPVAHICINFSTVYDTLVAKGLIDGQRVLNFAATQLPWYLYNLIAMMWGEVWYSVSSGNETTLSIGRVLFISPPLLWTRCF